MRWYANIPTHAHTYVQTCIHFYPFQCDTTQGKAKRAKLRLRRDTSLSVIVAYLKNRVNVITFALERLNEEGREIRGSGTEAGWHGLK